MTTYTFPSIEPNQTSIRLLSNTKAFVDPITGFTQTKSRNGTRWVITMSFNNLQGADRAIMKGFLGKLNGQVHRASIFDHSYIAARGALGGTPLVDGAGQSGTSLSSKGWPNTTLVLKAGDLISYSNGLNKELKMVNADSTSDGSGLLVIPISPEIHTSPADNASIDVTNPEGTFILGTPEIDWTNIPSQLAGIASPFSDFQLVFIEDIA